MRTLLVKTEVPINKSKGFFENEIVESLKGFVPGQWIAMSKSGEKTTVLGFVNPLAKRGPKAWSLGLRIDNADKFSIDSFIKSRISDSINYRRMLGIQGGRLVYGFEDGLPGLLVDAYENCVLIQVTTAGFDIYRSLIYETIKQITSQPVYFLDNKDYRDAECLPVHEAKCIDTYIKIRENNLQFEIQPHALQKIGFYYDQADNRARLASTVKKYNFKIQSCLDLFCYIGAWGLTACQLGARNVDFIDQAELGDTIKQNARINEISADIRFFRGDIFKALPSEIVNNKYDLIIYDPPALSKKKDDLKNALLGYEKGLRMALLPAKKGGLFVFSSCTHGVTFEQMTEIFSKVATRLHFNPRLLDLGMQRLDHPISSLSSQSFYLKYILYYMN